MKRLEGGTEVEKRSDARSERTRKRAYVSPALVPLGSVADLTRTSGGTKSDGTIGQN